MIASAFWIGLLWMAGPTGSASVTDREILNRAEAAFQSGVGARGSSEEAQHFQQAAEYYDQLRERGIHNPALMKNQGNAYLLAGDLADAIMAYRRGWRLNPNDRELHANLSFARDEVVYSSTDSFARPPESLWPPWLPQLTNRFTFWLVCFFYALAWFGLARRWTARIEHRPWIGWVGAGGGILFAVIFALQERGEKADSEYPPVVIAADQTYLRQGNHSLYPQAYNTPLNRGVEARLLQVRGNWLQIELTGRQGGWVPRENALVDLP
jgi:hypothetical protein